MIFFWALVAVLLCLVVYGLHDQSKVDPQSVAPRSLAVKIVIWCIKASRKLFTNVTTGVRDDINVMRSRIPFAKSKKKTPAKSDK